MASKNDEGTICFPWSTLIFAGLRARLPLKLLMVYELLLPINYYYYYCDDELPDDAVNVVAAACSISHCQCFVAIIVCVFSIITGKY